MCMQEKSSWGRHGGGRGVVRIAGQVLKRSIDIFLGRSKRIELDGSMSECG